MDKIKKNSRWLYLPVFLVSVLPCVLGYPLGMGVKAAAIQITAMSGAYLMFRTFSPNPLSVLLGVTLYLLSPYRIDLCYVQGDLLLSAVWAMVPWYLGGLMKVGKKSDRRILWIVFSAVVLGGIGYGSGVMFCILLALALLAALVFRCRDLLISMVAGAVLWLPGNVDFLMALFTNRVTDMVIPIKNITPEGYVLNDFLTSYVYHEGKPGLGLGLLLAAAIWLYVRFVCGGAKLTGESRLFGAVGVLSLCLATQYFPWELVQRVGSWALKFVSLIDTPALFTGFAALLLPVVFITAVDDLETAEEKIPAQGSLAVIWLAAMGVAIYLCNMLTYHTTAL